MENLKAFLAKHGIELTEDTDDLLTIYSERYDQQLSLVAMFDGEGIRFETCNEKG